MYLDDELPPGYIIRGGDDIIPSNGLLSREQNYVIDPEQKPNLEVSFQLYKIKKTTYQMQLSKGCVERMFEHIFLKSRFEMEIDTADYKTD